MRKFIYLLAMTLAVMLSTTNGWGQEVLFNEGFEYYKLPDGWTSTGDDISWYTSTTVNTYYPANVYSGSKAAVIHFNNSTGKFVKLISPEIDLSSNATVNLSFAYVNVNWSNDVDYINIYYRTSSSDSWHRIDAITSIHTSWTLSDEYEIQTSSSSTFQLAFEFEGNYGRGVGIDEVKIVAAASCDPIDVSTNPYIESFDSYESWGKNMKSINGCWKVSTGSSDRPMVNPDYKYSSSGKSLQLSDNDGGVSYIAFRNLFTNGTGSNDVAIKLYYQTGDKYNGILKVGVMSDPNDISTFEEISSCQVSSEWSFEKFTVIIPANKTDKYIAFKQNNSYVYSYIDQIEITTPPSCMDISNLTIGTVTPHTAQLSWTNGGSETQWIVSYSSDYGNNWTDVTADSNPYTITGLTDSKYYYVKVKSYCSSTEQGEYSPQKSFDTPAACPQVSNIQVTSSTTYADVNWTAGGTETKWYVSYGEGEYEHYIEEWSTPIEVTANCSTRITGLTPGTNYVVKIIADCDTEGQSQGATRSFTTQCEAQDITTIPFTEDFTNELSPCWKKNTNTSVGNGNLYVRAYYQDYGGGTGASYRGNVILPQLTTNGTNGVTISFKYKAEHNWAISGYLNIVLLDSPSDDIANGTIVGTIRTTDYTNYKDAVIDIPNFTNGKFIALASYEDDNDNFYCCITDLMVKTASSCNLPKQITISDIQRVRTTINWNIAGEDAKDYEFIVSKNQINDFAGVEATHTLLNSTETSFVLEGLERSTTYYAYMRHTCGDDGYSDWISAESSFTTGSLVDCTKDFEITIGTGNNTSNNIIAGEYYNYGYTQYLYTADELDNKNGVLKSISYQLYNFPSSYSPNWYVYIGTTENSTLTNWLPVSELTEVAHVTSKFNSIDWNTIEFENQFEYDGTKNIVVAVANKSGSYTSGNYAYYTLGGIGIERHLDGSSSYGEPSNTDNATIVHYRPNIKFTFCTQGDPCPQVKSITATGGKHSAEISWTPDVIDYLDHYELVISENGELDDEALEASEKTYSGTEKSVVTTEQPIGTYYAYVRCVCGNSDGTSDWVRSEAFEVLTDCDAVTDLYATENGLITWTAADETSYNLQYRMKGAEAWTAVTEGIGDGECQLTGLAMHTTYEVRIQADCGGEDQSNWSEPVEFTTPCGEITITKAEPYVYGFEDAENYTQNIPCWGVELISDYYDNIPYTWNSGARSGNMCVGFTAYADWAFDKQMISTPTITNEIRTLEMTLYAKENTQQYGNVQLEIGVLDNANNYTAIQQITINSTDYQEFTIPLGNAPVGSKKIAINCLPLSQNVQVNIFVDDITIGLAPSCKKPTAISVDNITYNGAEVNVTAEETDFEYVVSTSEIDVENIQDGDIQTSSTNPIDLTDLSEETEYYVAVRCSCGTDDKSDWTVLNTPFTTAAQCYPIASEITVGGDNSQVTLTWTPATGATGYKYILSETELETPDFTSATTITTASMTFEVGGQGNLKGETNYWFYVKNDCNEGIHANDYKSVQFTTPETCPSPKNVTVTDVQKYQFTIAWEKSEFADEYQEYELIVNTTGEQPDIYDEAQVDEITGTNYTIENLARNTHYYVYMRGTCDDVPEWKLVAEATTLGLGMDCDYETIANSTATNKYAPIYGEVIMNSQKVQMLYPASKLQTLHGSNISQMKFFLNYGSSYYWNDSQFNIKMAMTTATDLSSDFINETMTTVYSGPLTIDGSTMTIELSSAFEYTANNLLIEFELPASQASSSNSTIFYSETNDFVCTRFNYIGFDYPETSKNLPKVEFKVCEEVKACPEVTNLKANYISYNNATIFWDASNGDFLTGYEFAWGDEEIIDFSQVQTRTIGKNEDREVRLDHLTPSTKYYVYVRALCPNDPNEQQSNWLPIEFTTAEFNCDAPAPQQDRFESVTLNDQYPESSIIVYWGPNNAQQIELYYTTEAGFEPTKETVANEKVTSENELIYGFHTITGLDVNTTYYVWARAVCDLGMDNDGKSGWTLMGSATTEADKKFIIFENVGYTISGVHQGKVTIINATYNEDDLTPVDYDITYAENEDEEPGIYDYFNYKYVINVPEKFIDIEQNNTEYEVIAIAANAFDNSIEKYNNIRVNIPLNTVVEGMSVDENVIISLADENRIINNDNTYYASKAYKVNLCYGAEIVQRPFGEQTLIISCPDDEEGTDEDGVVTTQTGARLDFEDGWTETQASTSNMLEASLEEEESVITVTRLNKVRIAATAENVNIPELENCEELKFQTDVTGGAENRKYPECTIDSNITLNDTKVKVEMKLNNKEYYYFALPFGCDIDDIKVVAGDDEIERSYSVAAAASEAVNDHRYVLLTWDESEYDGTTSGYVALDGNATVLEANKGYAILIMESYNSWYADHNVTVDATATFTANSNYTEMVSTSEQVDIATTRKDLMNTYSGWNLVGNPYYSTIKGSWYSYNQYASKIGFDRGGTDVSVKDYKPDVPVFNVDIKPFETLFVQQDDGAGEGTLTVGNPTLPNTQQAPAVLPEYITITLNDSSRMMDRTTIINNDMASDGYMQTEDLVKSHLSSNEIYTTYYDIDFSFNEMNIEEGKKVIPVGVKVANEGDYTIALSEDLTNYGIGNVVLHDKTLNKFTTLSEGEEETLHLGKGRTDGRLELIITVNETITSGEDTDDNGKVEVFVNNGIATINGAETGAIVMITDATGKTIYTTEATGDRIDYEFAVRGVYMITVRGERVSTMKVVY